MGVDFSLDHEFMDEDELLAEFHRAGIWLEDEPRWEIRVGNYIPVRREASTFDYIKPSFAGVKLILPRDREHA